MSDFVLSQLLVAVVLCFDVASFQFRDKRKVLACLVFSALLLGVHFYLVEAYTAATLGFIGALRFATAIFSHARWLLAVFITLVLINGVISFAGWITVLATTGALITTTASFLASDQKFRQFMMLGTVVWIVHNAIAGSPAAVLLEMIFLASNLWGYYRFYIRDGFQKS